MAISCVKCGQELEDYSHEDVLVLPVAPTCEECILQVAEETIKGVSMWPSGWHGHAIKSGKLKKWVCFDTMLDYDDFVKDYEQRYGKGSFR